MATRRPARATTPDVRARSAHARRALPSNGVSPRVSNGDQSSARQFESAKSFPEGRRVSPLAHAWVFSFVALEAEGSDPGLTPQRTQEESCKLPRDKSDKSAIRQALVRALSFGRRNGASKGATVSDQEGIHGQGLPPQEVRVSPFWRTGDDLGLPRFWSVATAIGRSMALSGHDRLQRRGLPGSACSPVGSSSVPSASASRAWAEPGRRGFCWLSCGAQPVRVTISKVAGMRPSGRPKRSQ